MQLPDELVGPGPYGGDFRWVKEAGLLSSAQQSKQVAVTVF